MKDPPAELREARFVLVVGDLADGAGLSSSPGKILGTSLGLTPPLSPYEDEYRNLRRELVSFRLPIFGVPGNHDGFASYGGFVNDGLETMAAAFKLPVPILPGCCTPSARGCPGSPAPCPP